MNLPTGTVTFLFTDIEGSTRLWEEAPDAMRDAVARHDALLRQAVDANKGIVFKTTADGIAAAFALAADALAAALQAQIALHAEAWPGDAVLRSRMAVHTGAAETRDGDYFGPALNRTARLMASGHGGQTLLSDVTYELTRDHVPPDVSLLLLGEFRLKDLARPETIFEFRHPLLATGFPALRTLELLPNNLPQQVTSFIGREAAFADVIALLAKTRLLTLTGAGGTGKTRLALQAAADVLERYPNGVWQVELAPLADPALVPQTVGGVLGIREQAGQTLTQTLTDALKDKELLIVLDNCEHLVSACAQFVATLIRGCPNVTVLATSREALGIGGEQVYRVPSLSLPDPKKSATATGESLSQFEAVRLFIDRTLSSKSDFAVTNQSAPALAQLCYRLDGIPLAIELAAARVRSLTVEQINDRLDSRFRLLTGGDRSALPRHQTLRALIDWGYDLLGDSEKALLDRPSVFAGGWTIEAAQSVCAGDLVDDWEVLDLLTSLSDKSLILPEEIPGESATRYRMLESIRQYSAERLQDSADETQVGERHVAFFLALLEEAEPKLNGPEKLMWLNCLETEHDNLRTALHFCATQMEPANSPAPGALAALSGLRLGGALLPFWEARGYLTEGRAHLAEALTRRHAAEHAARSGLTEASAATKTVAGALVAAGRGAWRQGDYPAAQSLMDESLALYRENDDRKSMAWTLNNLGNLDIALGKYTEAQARYAESLALARESGEIQAISIAVSNLGNLAFYRGDLDLARSLSEESLAVERTIGDKTGIAYALINLGACAHNQGDFQESRSFYEERLPLLREIGDKSAVAITLMNIGNSEFATRDDALATVRYEEALPLFRQVGDKSGTGVVLMSLGNVAKYRGDYGAAHVWFEESLVLAREIGDRHSVASTLNSLAGVNEVEGNHSLALALYEEALDLRREIGDKRGIGTTLASMGELAFGQADYAVAGMRFSEALGFYRDVSDKSGAAVGLQNVAAVCAFIGNDPLRVAMLLGASRSLFESLGTAEHHVDPDMISAQARAALNDDAAWSAAWVDGTALPSEETVKLALGE